MQSKTTRFGLFIALCSLFFFSTTSAQLVTKSVDDGSDGTLRQEIADTPAGGTITFAEDIETIVISSELLIEKELIITADSTARVTINAERNSRIFNITAGPVTFIYLNLKNGSAGRGDGGAIISTGADLTFEFTNITESDASNGGAAYITEASNVTFRNGTIELNLGFQQGGGVYVQAENTTFENILINRNGSDDAGGGIYNSGGNLNIFASTISSNWFTSQTDVSNDGAGLYNAGGNLVIENSTFTNNDSRNYGGAILCAGGTLKITDSEISGNYAQYAGAGLFLSSNTLVTLNNVNITGNSGQNPLGGQGRNDGGGISAFGNENIVINGGNIRNNTGYRDGGGIAFGGGTLTINGTNIAFNGANFEGLSTGGGGIYCNSGQLILNAGTQIMGNVVAENNNDDTQEGGGGILMEGDGLLIINSPVENPVVFQSNFARGSGGAIAYRSSETLDLNNVVFTENVAFYGGALHTTGSSVINITDGEFKNNGQGDETSNEGGAIWNNNGTLNIDGTLLSGNFASDRGGALFNNGGTINIVNAEINRNDSYNGLGMGGGIYNTAGGSLSITHSTLSRNAAYYGGGIVDNSTMGQGSLNLNDVILTANEGYLDFGLGGGLYMLGNGTAIIKSCEISNNSADNQGGAIWNDAASFNISTTTISGNSTLGSDFHESFDGNAGAIYNKAGSFYIDASTLVLNKADGAGGAIYNATSVATTTLKNSIVALNSAVEGNNFAGENDFISADYNLIGEDSLAVFSAMSNDLEGTFEIPLNPMIDSLANNGGFTQTHALVDGSPAFNAGNPIDTFPDQRGEPVFAERRDIGAFEAQVTLGIENNFAASGKSLLYPNPSKNGFVQLNIPDSVTSAVRISVIEIGSGKVVLSQEGKSGRNTLKTDRLRAGTYIIRLVSDRAVESLKMLVSR